MTSFYRWSDVLDSFEAHKSFSNHADEHNHQVLHNAQSSCIVRAVEKSDRPNT